MTEAEWLGATDPKPMLKVLRGTASDRKLRLFAVACCIQVRHLMPPDPRTWDAVVLAELFADGEAPYEKLAVAAETAFSIFEATEDEVQRLAAAAATEAAASPSELRVGRAWERAALAIEGEAWGKDAHQQGPEHYREMMAAWSEAWLGSGRVQGWTTADPDSLFAHFLRCVFGNPNRPVTVDPGWRTSAVVALAQQMYDSRDFSLMHVLADALQDAGCESADMLTHCRSADQHVRGCWVVDSLLGKQ